uniref:alpha/beta fold hydrolase n=1 Tax=Paractinoplanes polyasparticus TaxID=2856853 RepID=UPI001C84A060|nr:alpha/beta hydrolase [Actinoplanes polyasparticus]
MTGLPVRHVTTDVLEVAYHEAGPSDGPPVLLLHGFPYDIHSCVEVAPLLAAAGHRVIVPYLRGHGPTRFLSAETPRSGQQAALGADARGIAEVIWRRNSPKWTFGAGELDRAAEAFANPDYVDVVIHSYRHRLGRAAGAPAYERAEGALSRLPAITVPAVTLDGTADGNFPATDGSPTAARFTGPRVHRQVPDAGHNLPQEAPAAFTDAVREVASLIVT